MKMNGHGHKPGKQQPDQVDQARTILAEDWQPAFEAYERQRMGIPMPKQEPPKPQPTERALRLARMLIDPRYGR